MKLSTLLKTEFEATKKYHELSIKAENYQYFGKPFLRIANKAETQSKKADKCIEQLKEGIKTGKYTKEQFYDFLNSESGLGYFADCFTDHFENPEN